MNKTLLGVTQSKFGDIIVGKKDSIKGVRKPPTQFFVDGCYARLILLYIYRGFSTVTQGHSTCRKSRSLILERIWRKYQEISGSGCKTL